MKDWMKTTLADRIESHVLDEVKDLLSQCDVDDEEYRELYQSTIEYLGQNLTINIQWKTLPEHSSPLSLSAPSRGKVPTPVPGVLKRNFADKADNRSMPPPGAWSADVRYRNYGTTYCHYPQGCSWRSAYLYATSRALLPKRKSLPLAYVWRRHQRRCNSVLLWSIWLCRRHPEACHLNTWDVRAHGCHSLI